MTESDILDGLRRVRVIAKRYARTRLLHEYMDDLIGAGNLGLAKAWATYSDACNVPFAAWAAIKIESAVRDEIKMLYRRGDSSVSLDTGRDGDPIDVPAESPDVITAVAVAEMCACIDRLPNESKGRSKQLRSVAVLMLDEVPLTEMGKRLGFTASNACVLRQQAIEHLRGMMGAIAA